VEAAPDASGDASTRAYARTSLSNAATCFSRAGMPVEAREAFRLLLSEFGPQLSPADRDAIEAALARLDDRIGELEIRGVPLRGEVRVDGRAVTLDGVRPLPLAAGTRALEVRAEGYKPWATTVTVVGRARSALEVKLLPSDLPAQVRIESTADPAEVEIDGAPVGRAPVEKVLPPGEHRFRVTSGNYHPESGTFDVLPNERTRMKVTLTPSRGALGLRLEPVFTFSYNLRGDTPLNTAVGSDLDFQDGVRLAFGGGVRLYYQFDRRKSFRLGAELRMVSRPLDEFGFGVTGQYCPATWSAGKDGAVRFCPFGFSVGYTLSGSTVGPFTSGENYTSARAAVLFGRDTLSGFIAAGATYETYKRDTITTLGLWVASVEFGLGLDL